MPQQLTTAIHSNDCGIFVCMFAIFASDPYVKDGLNIQLLKPDKMNLFRKRLALYIMKVSTESAESTTLSPFNV